MFHTQIVFTYLNLLDAKIQPIIKNLVNSLIDIMANLKNQDKFMKYLLR